MANNPINMSKVRKVIQLYEKGKSKLFISNYLSVARNTVKKYLSLYQILGLSLEDINNRTDAELESLFIANAEVELSPKIKNLYAFFPYMERQLKKTGTTKMLLWRAYIEQY